MSFSATSPLTSAVESLLVSGGVPKEWASTALVVNFCDGSSRQRAVMEEAIRMAAKLHAEPTPVTKESSPSCYPFPMEPKFKLSQDLQAAGWVQWHVTVARGETKRDRYPVHMWIAPDGRVALVKIKLEGKNPL